jgi:hypothetical protein
MYVGYRIGREHDEEREEIFLQRVDPVDAESGTFQHQFKIQIGEN